MHRLWRCPWVLPMVMVAWNVFFVTISFITEGRLKLTALKFLVAYAGTVKPAMRGDMEPFIQVFSLPG